MRIKRRDLKALIDQADYAIYQVDSPIRNGCKVIKMICFNADGFMLLCSIYIARVYMKDFSGHKNLTRICRTVKTTQN